MAELRYYSLYEDQEFDIYLIKIVDACLIYLIKTLEHSMVSFFLILEGLNAI